MKVWEAAQRILLPANKSQGGFDIGFDDTIDEEIRTYYREFIVWVENSFAIPVTLWVDFENKNYLIGRDNKRKGYLFYWRDIFDHLDLKNPNDWPVIRLPIKGTYLSYRSIIGSFIEAISHYYAWLLNCDMELFTPDQQEVNEILSKYFADK